MEKDRESAGKTYRFLLLWKNELKNRFEEDKFYSDKDFFYKKRSFL